MCRLFFARRLARISPIEWILMKDPPHNSRQFLLYKCYPAHTIAKTV